MTEPLKDYNIQFKVRNNHLLQAMRLNGIENASQLARKVGLSPASVGKYLNLKLEPIRQNGEWRRDLKRIADFLHFLPEDLFPPQHIKHPLKKNTNEIEISVDEIKMLVGDGNDISEEQRYLQEENGDLGNNLEEAMKVLPARINRVITKRFGLDGKKPMTLDEVAYDFSISSQRVRQIQEKGLRMLRHPTRSKELRAFK